MPHNLNSPEPNFGAIDNRLLGGKRRFAQSATPLTLSESADLGQALSFLREHKIGAVLVTDALGKVSGIFTERDVILRVALQGLRTNSALKTIMTPNPRTIQMTTTIAFALAADVRAGFSPSADSRQRQLSDRHYFHKRYRQLPGADGNRLAERIREQRQNMRRTAINK